MGNSAIDDEDALYAAADEVGASVDLGDHTARDRAFGYHRVDLIEVDL